MNNQEKVITNTKLKSMKTDENNTMKTKTKWMIGEENYISTTKMS